MFIREHISGTAGPIFTKFCVRIPCGRSLVLRWCCTTLCTSGFMDDVTFGHNVRDASNTGAESDIYECLLQQAIQMALGQDWSTKTKGKLYHTPLWEHRQGAHFPSFGHEHVGGYITKFVTHGQCNTRPTVTFQAAQCNRSLVGTKLYCLVTEQHRRK